MTIGVLNSGTSLKVVDFEDLNAQTWQSNASGQSTFAMPAWEESALGPRKLNGVAQQVLAKWILQ